MNVKPFSPDASLAKLKPVHKHLLSLQSHNLIRINAVYLHWNKLKEAELLNPHKSMTKDNTHILHAQYNDYLIHQNALYLTLKHFIVKLRMDERKISNIQPFI